MCRNRWLTGVTSYRNALAHAASKRYAQTGICNWVQLPFPLATYKWVHAYGKAKVNIVPK